MVGEPALEGFEQDSDIVWGAVPWWLSSSGETVCQKAAEEASAGV